MLYNKEKLLANGDRAETEIAANLHGSSVVNLRPKASANIVSTFEQLTTSTGKALSLAIAYLLLCATFAHVVDVIATPRKLIAWSFCFTRASDSSLCRTCN